MAVTGLVSALLVGIGAVLISSLLGVYHDRIDLIMGESSDDLILHRAITKDWMCWGDSTTPIPISYAAKLTKHILAGEKESLPEELAASVSSDGYDTVSIQRAWEFIRSERLKHVQELCTGDHEETCKKSVTYADKRFGLTPLHLAKYSRDEKLAEYLTALGADSSALDIAGRKPMNVSFTNFIVNARNAAKASGNECEIPQVIADPNGAWKKEVKRLVREGEPVIVRGVVPGPPPTLDELVDSYGDAKVRVGAVPYADYFGMDIEHLTLRDFVEKSVKGDDDGAMPMYVFAKDATIGAAIFDTMATIVREAFPVPEIFTDPAKIGATALHFALGRDGSGAPIHIHSDALNLVLAGTKRWFVLPPQDAIYSRKHISAWVKEDLENTQPQPLQCVQGPGDAIYVPFDWAHGVINGGEFTFAYALELLSERDSLKTFR